MLYRDVQKEGRAAKLNFLSHDTTGMEKVAGIVIRQFVYVETVLNTILGALL